MELIEREAELAVVDRSIRDAVAGRGCVVVVEGPAGIGKTSLLDEASRRAAAAGMTVISGQGAVLEHDFGFGVARQLFEPVIGAAAEDERHRLLARAAALAAPVVAPAELTAVEASPGQQAAMVHGLYWLTANLAERAPALIVVDDAHWSDAPSLHYLTYLARRLEGTAVLLLVAFRNWEAQLDAPVMAELVAGPGVRAIRPEPLSADGVGRLVRAGLGPAADERFIDACRDASGGVPFLVRELVRALRADGVQSTAEAATSIVTMGPATVAHATTLRLSRVAPSATAVARAVAVLGRHARLDRVAALAETTDDDTRAAVDVLTGMEILAPGPLVRFAHPLVHQAIYDDLAPATRAAGHDRAARLLLAEQAPADEVAAHLLLTDPMGRDEVVETLRVAAGRALVRAAPASAVAYLRRALSEGAAVGTRAALLHDVGRAEALAGDAGAADDLEEALRLTADPVARARISYDLSNVHLMSGRWKERVTLLRDALVDLGERDPDLTARIEAAASASEFHDPQFTSDFEARLPRYRALIDRGEPGSRHLAAVVAGVGASRGMDRGEILALARQGLDGGRLLDDEGAESLMVVQGVTALILIDELDAADTASEGVLDNARRRGSVAGYGVGWYYRLWIDAQRGLLQGADVHLHSIVEVALEHGLLFGLPSAFLAAADALLERRQLDDVAALVESVELPPPLAASSSGAWVMAVRGRLRFMRGQRDAAIADLRAAGEILTALEFRNPLAAPWRSPLALALGAENAKEARALADDELRDATELGLARCRGVALRTAGCLEGGSRGMELLEESLRVLDHTDAHLERARTLVELGAAQRRANQRVVARDPLRAGLDLAHRCGAERLAERAVEELQLCGARPRRRVLSGPEALTPGEARVARMAAVGMTNREIAQDLFVTAKTVENQLGAVYSKLGVRSRAQLGAALDVTS